MLISEGMIVVGFFFFFFWFHFNLIGKVIIVRLHESNVQIFSIDIFNYISKKYTLTYFINV